ncbi:MAG: tetratricopeptide repeat protein, partial [Myxococcota bacterium]
LVSAAAALRLTAEVCAAVPDHRAYVDAEAYFHALRAELALDRRDWDVAHDEFRLALVHDPSSVHLHDKLIRLALAQGPLTRARRYVRRALLMAPEHWELLRLQGIVAQAEGRFKEAERALSEARRQAPHDAETGLTLAAVFAAQGRLDAAVKLLENQAKVHRNDPRPLLAAAVHLRAVGRWAEAARALERAAARDALDASPTEDLADAYERLGRLDDALRIWRGFASRHTSRSKPRLRAARLALALDRVEAAERLLDAARRLDPQAAVGEVYAAEGFDRRAVPFLRRALRANPTPAARWRLARSLARLGRGEEALDHLSRLTKNSEPSESLRIAALRLVADIRWHRGEFENALSILKRALTEYPSSTVVLADYVERQLTRSPAKALTALVQAQRTMPAAPEVWALSVRAAEAMAPNGPVDRIERWWARAKRDPRNIEVQLLSAERAASLPAASAAAARAFAEAPTDPRAVAAAGMVALRAGDQGRAIEHLARAVRLDPWNAEYAERWGDAAAATKRWATARRAYAAAQRVLETQSDAPQTDASRSGVRGQSALRRLRVKQQLARKAL